MENIFVKWKIQIEFFPHGKYIFHYGKYFSVWENIFPYWQKFLLKWKNILPIWKIHFANMENIFPREKNYFFYVTEAYFPSEKNIFRDRKIFYILEKLSRELQNMKCIQPSNFNSYRGWVGQPRSIGK